MRSTGSTTRPSDGGERPDWLAMDLRLTKIEDTLVTIQTVVNLMLDLLERSIPADLETDQAEGSSPSASE